MCNTGSCKTSNKIWGIVDDTKLYRLTFSRSLADLICSYFNDAYKVKRFDCILGQPLLSHEASKTGLYAIQSRLNGAGLRVQMIRDIANMYRDDSIDVVEAYLVPL